MRRFIQRILTRAIETVGTVSRILTGQPPGLGPMPLSFWWGRNDAAPPAAPPRLRGPRT